MELDGIDDPGQRRSLNPVRKKMATARMAYSMIGAATLKRNGYIHSEDEGRPTDHLGTWVLYKNNNFDFYNNDFDGDVDDACLDTDEPDNSELQLNFVLGNEKSIV